MFVEIAQNQDHDFPYGNICFDIDTKNNIDFLTEKRDRVLFMFYKPQSPNGELLEYLNSYKKRINMQKGVYRRPLA